MQPEVNTETRRDQFDGLEGFVAAQVTPRGFCGTCKNKGQLLGGGHSSRFWTFQGCAKSIPSVRWSATHTHNVQKDL